MSRDRVGWTRHGSPRRCGVAASQKLIVFRSMASGTVLRSEFLRDYEASVIDLFLSFGRSVAVQAVHGARGVRAHLELMYHGRGFATMAPCALAGRTHETRRRLQRVRRWTLRVNQKTGDDQCGSQKNGYEY